MKRTIFSNQLLPWLLLAPQLAITFIFFLWPAGQAIKQSFLRALGGWRLDPGACGQLGLLNLRFTSPVCPRPCAGASGRGANSHKRYKMAARDRRPFQKQRQAGLRSAPYSASGKLDPSLKGPVATLRGSGLLQTGLPSGVRRRSA